MRARHPDVEGRVVRDGVTLGYEVNCDPDAKGCEDAVGHMPNLRDPVRFNHLVREFVERVS